MDSTGALLDMRVYFVRQTSYLITAYLTDSSSSLHTHTQNTDRPRRQCCVPQPLLQPICMATPVVIRPQEVGVGPKCRQVPRSGLGDR